MVVMLNKVEITKIYFTLPQFVIELNKRLGLIGKHLISESTFRYHLDSGFMNITPKGEDDRFWKFHIDTIHIAIEFYKLHLNYGVKASKVKQILTIVNKNLI
jgi:hypothetical protein